MLKNKKIIGALIIGVVAVGGALLLTQSKTEYIVSSQLPANVKAAESIKNVLAKSTQEVDTDGDGLFDWEEELWGTDIRNPDTDEDGMDDGTEVRANRDPTKAGEDALGGASTLPRAAPDTDTERFAQNFFTEYLSLKQSGEDLDSLSKEFIVTAALKRARGSSGFRVYTKEDLTIVPATDSAVRTYGTALGKTISQYGTSNTPHEFIVLEEALPQKDASRMADLDPRIRDYEALQGALAQTIVPETFAGEHVRMLNALSVFVRNMKDIRYVFDDPLPALRAIGAYYDDTAALAGAIRALQQSLFEAPVSFPPSDPGSVFMNL